LLELAWASSSIKQIRSQSVDDNSSGRAAARLAISLSRETAELLEPALRILAAKGIGFWRRPEVAKLGVLDMQAHHQKKAQKKLICGAANKSTTAGMRVSFSTRPFFLMGSCLSCPYVLCMVYVAMTIPLDETGLHGTS
jgi:hypothetical protein